MDSDFCQKASHRAILLFNRLIEQLFRVTAFTCNSAIEYIYNPSKMHADITVVVESLGMFSKQILNNSVNGLDQHS